MTAKVVHCQRERYDVYIGRTIQLSGLHDSGLGNPFRLKSESERSKVLADFERYARVRIGIDPAFRALVQSCHGKVLGCWCAPKACHGDVLLKLAAEIHEEPPLPQAAA